MTGYYNVMSGGGAVPEVLGLHSTDGEEKREGGIMSGVSSSQR